MSADDDELAELREERMQELQEQGGAEPDEEAIQAQQEAAEAQKKAVLRQHLTDGARQRLNNVKMSKPEVGEQIEQQVVALAQSGRVNGKIDEDQMKQLLQELTPDSKSFNVRHR